MRVRIREFCSIRIGKILVARFPAEIAELNLGKGSLKSKKGPSTERQIKSKLALYRRIVEDLEARNFLDIT